MTSYPFTISFACGRRISSELDVYVDIHAGDELREKLEDKHPITSILSFYWVTHDKSPPFLVLLKPDNIVGS